jgi:hypothetical protein
VKLLVSYFEIGGHIVETGLNISESMESNFITPLDFAPIIKPVDVGVGLVAKAVFKTTKKESYDPIRAARAPGRARRARYALQMAAALAAVDGPLPFGDALAIGVLGTYATYEVVGAVGDIIQ